MRLALPTSFVLLLVPLWAGPAFSQPLADTLFAWQDYGRTAQCHVRLYAAPANADRPFTILIQEVAENSGRAAAADLPYLAEMVGRRLDVDAAEATWVVHWGSFSFAGAREDEKELFLRATFRRNASGHLGSPAWRLLARAEVEALTDRQFH